MALNNHASHDKPGVCKLQLSGRLDTNTAPTLDSTLTELLGGDLNLLIFDMAGIEYISSAGLRVIFKGTKLIKQKGGRAGVMKLQPQISNCGKKQKRNWMRCVSKFAGQKNITSCPLAQYC